MVESVPWTCVRPQSCLQWPCGCCASPMPRFLATCALQDVIAHANLVRLVYLSVLVLVLFCCLGDNWQVLCSGKTWRRDNKVQFKHVDTNK